ncbi:MAG: FadR family transcriptional regulator [Actinobacteria bacterium]|nr:FadR family transcriptional regulator [Actinomycetota bacterium]MBI3686411.1 FadR family transcriptional regulator [Actinomycetota bacterium]
MTHRTPTAGPSIAQDAVFRPVRGGNAFEETVERILQAIKLGVVTYGERLPTERALSARLKISRVTLREAIRSLQQAGYVESRRGRTGGTFVTYRPTVRYLPGSETVQLMADHPSPALGDLLTLREVLEVGAAEMAARRRPNPDEKELLCQRLTDAETASLAGFRQMDSRLHLAIAELSGSTALASMVADVRMRINALLDAIPLLPPNLDHSTVQHRAIVAAIADGDELAARLAVREHLDGTAALLRGFFG